MSNVPSVVSENEKSSRLDIAPLEELHALQEEGMNEIRSHKTGEPKMVKMSAVSQEQFQRLVC